MLSADTEALIQTVREALTGRISAPHDDYCSWMTSGKCDCGLAESEARFDGTLAALDSLTAELERVKAERDENMAEALRWAERCNVALTALREIAKWPAAGVAQKRARTAIAESDG